MRVNLSRGWMMCIAVLSAMLCMGGASSAQEPKSSNADKKQSSSSKEDEVIQDKKFDVPYWDRSEAFQIRAAVAVIGEGDAFGALAARVAISENVPIVQGWEFFFEKALPLNSAYLDLIRDGRPLPDLRAKEFRDLQVPDRGMYLAYINALRRSNSATVEMLQRSASDNENVTYTHLSADPKLYRGKVIAVKGTLKVVRVLDAPPMVFADGITKIYEGWIVGRGKASPPFAVVFTQLPNELNRPEILEGATLSAAVTFHGYYLGNVLFPADKARGSTQKDLVCPWLIGKTLMMAEFTPAAKDLNRETSNSYEIAGYTVGTIFVIAILIGLLNLYFRRSDANTQKKLAELRDKHQSFVVDEGKTEENQGPEQANPDQDWPGRMGS